jgi:hypothetical protein
MSEFSRVPRLRNADVRQAVDLAVAGGIGAAFGLFQYTELVHVGSLWMRDALAGGLIGGLIGFALNASGPLRDGSWPAMARASAWGALAGAIGGALGLVLGEFALGGLQGGLLGRSVSWSILGLGIGASQGLAYRSRQKLAFGLIGGGLGGLVGGFLFELLRQSFGSRYDLGQGLGIVVLGAGLGLALAAVEQALRRAWVVVMSGRQEGRSYLVLRPVVTLGLDERADIGLFADPTIARAHAEIRRDGRGYVLHPVGGGRTRINGVDLAGPTGLSDGDRVELGQTLLVFRSR